MADGIAEIGLHRAARIAGAHGELGDLVVEIDETLDDHPALIHPPAGGGIVPGGLHVVRPLEQRLALSRRGHHRLDDARVTNGRLAVAAVDGSLQLGQGIGKAVRRGGQAQLLGGQAADALPIHGELGGPSGGDHLGHALGLDLHQHVGGDGLDLGHDQMGLLLLDQSTQGGAVGHRDHMGPVGHLVAGGVGVAIHGNRLDTQALQRDQDFLTQLAGAKKHHAQGAG